MPPRSLEPMQGYPCFTPPSTSGLGHSPFKAVARVRIPSGACGPVAQLVEQGTFNPKVAGSIPARPIAKGLQRASFPQEAAERLVAARPHSLTAVWAGARPYPLRPEPRLRMGEVDAVWPAGIVEGVDDHVVLLVVDDRDPRARALERREREVPAR